MERAEVAIIGAGLVGAAIAYELATRGVRVVVLEAEADVGAGASRSNSGIVHTGFDSPPGTLETAMIRAQAARWRQVFDTLGVPYRIPGALLVAVDGEQAAQLPAIAAQAAHNGVPVELLSAAEVQRAEPGVVGVAGLRVPGEAMTDPLVLVRRLLASGPDVRLRWPVAAVAPTAEGASITGPAGAIQAKFVVNCAGLYADAVAADQTFRITPRRGEFLVFEAGSGSLVRHILLPMPTARTKGVLVFPTLYGQLCAGPSAVDQEDKADWRPRAAELRIVHERAAAILPVLATMRPVDAWAGLRPAGQPHNYIVDWSPRVPAMLNVAGIRSTGLSACLGLAEHVLGLLGEHGLQTAPPRSPLPGGITAPQTPWWQQLTRSAEYTGMLIGIDQGTTGTTVVAYDPELRPRAQAYRPLPNRYPRPGWVEQHGDDIVAGVVDATAEVLAQIGGRAAVTAVGLANQGETVIAWDSVTDQAITPAIVWSDNRGAAITAPLRRAGWADRVRALTGLELDPYFSAAKIAWLLQQHAGVREAAATQRLRVGTLDTWIAWRLGGRQARTDHATASRTQLFALHGADWSPELLELFGVPAATLAAIEPSVGDWGNLDHPSWGGSLPWRASLVDQPAALVGNACVRPSDVKATYGTGCFILVNAGHEPPEPPPGLLASVAWSNVERRTYAFDGGVFSAGTLLQWLAAVGIVGDVTETAALAESVPDTNGVRLLPALSGLGAPWWDNDARAVFGGITSGTTRAHLVRAALDAIAFRVRDVLEAAWAAGQPRPAVLRVDGGLTNNRYLLQRQADVLDAPVERAADPELTARGAAALAGVGANVLLEQDLSALIPAGMRYEPRAPRDQIDGEYGSWRNWLMRARQLEAAEPRPA